MISNRDKVTNEFNLSLDGNFYQTLHSIYNNLSTIDSVVITIPLNVCKQSIEVFNKFNSDYLNNIVKILHVPKFYGTNAAEHRDMFIKNFNESFNLGYYDQVISDFSVKIKHSNVSYRYNWSKVSDNDNTESAKYFDLECELAKTFDTYVFSDIQYKYMSDKASTSKIYRLEKIYSSKLLTERCRNVIDNTSFDIKTKVENKYSSFTELIKVPKIFYPSRLEDVRYRYDLVQEYSISNNLPTIVTNPTNIDILKYKLSNSNLIEVSTVNKLYEYYLWLTMLTEDDIIFNHSDDFHVSLLEQIVICKAKNVSPFTKEQLDSYIYE